MSESRYLVKPVRGTPDKRIGVRLLSPEGTVIKSFNSFTECGKFLGAYFGKLYLINRRQPVLFECRLCSLKKVENVPTDDSY